MINIPVETEERSMAISAKPSNDVVLQAGARVLAQVWGREPVASSLLLGWDGLCVCVWNICVETYAVDSVPEPLFALHTAGVIDRIGNRVMPARRSTAGRVSLFPTGSGGDFQGHGMANLVTVHLSEQRLRGLVSEDQMSKGLMEGNPHFGVSDKYISASITALASEIAQPSIHGALYAESVADALTLHVLRPMWQSIDAPSKGAALPDRRVNAIVDWIEVNLAGPISLGDMATAAGLSRFHFSHLFRRATGMPPYQFVTQKRIERAKRMLQCSDLPVVDVALAVGFSSQARFCECFRRVCGLTPSSYRRQRLE